MSLFVFFYSLFICKRQCINYLGWERESLLFCCCCLSVIMWFLFDEAPSFLWVLGMGYAILLWHSMSLPYNYFTFICKSKTLTLSVL